jgi:hypothetical protein
MSNFLSPPDKAGGLSLGALALFAAMLLIACGENIVDITLAKSRAQGTKMETFEPVVFNTQRALWEREHPYFYEFVQIHYDSK